MLDWRNGLVGNVLDELMQGWENQGKSVRFKELVKDVSIHPRALSVRVNWNEADIAMRRFKAESAEFDLVLLAVGFGVESVILPSSHHYSYWHRDDFDEHRMLRPATDKPTRWLVSGAGDGALIDLARLCILDFRHESLIEDFMSEPDIFAAIKLIQEIEGHPDARDPDRPEYLHDAYQRLRIPCVIAKLEPRLRSDTQVTLNSASPFFFQRDSSVLNRVLASQLRHLGAFQFIPGKLLASTAPEGHQIRVDLENHKESLYFDRVVVRHGPVEALREFPQVWEETADLRENWRKRPHLLDHTRERLWEAGTFGPEERPDLISFETASQAIRIRSLISPTLDLAPTFNRTLGEFGRRRRGAAESQKYIEADVTKLIAALPSKSVADRSRQTENLLTAANASFAWYELSNEWVRWLELYEDFIVGMVSGLHAKLHPLLVVALNCAGICCRMLGRNDARKFYEQAQAFATPHHDLLSDVEANLSDLDRIEGRAKEASLHGQNALSLAKAAKDEGRTARAYEVLGLVKVGDRAFDDALLLYYPACDLRRRSGDLRYYSRALSYLAFAQALSRDPSSTFHTFDEAVEIEKGLENDQAIARLHGDVAFAHIRLGSWEAAIQALAVTAARNPERGLSPRYRALHDLRVAMARIGAVTADRQDPSLSCRSVESAIENTNNLSRFDLEASDAIRILKDLVEALSPHAAIQELRDLIHRLITILEQKLALA